MAKGSSKKCKFGKVTRGRRKGQCRKSRRKKKAIGLMGLGRRRRRRR